MKDSRLQQRKSYIRLVLVALGAFLLCLNASIQLATPPEGETVESEEQKTGAAATDQVLETEADSFETSTTDDFIEEEVVDLSTSEEQPPAANEDDVQEVVVGESIPSESDAPSQEEEAEYVPGTVKVNFPIYVTSLFKSGTTTVHDYFECGGVRSVHFQGKAGRTGYCLERNIIKNVDLFKGCGDYDVWTDNAYLRKGNCFEPSIHGGLDNFYQNYPNATILNVWRDSYKWLSSVSRYKFANWELLAMLKNDCPGPGYFTRWANKTVTDEDVRLFYLWQQEYVHNWTQAHPSITFVDVGLEDENIAEILQDKIGIPSSCWGQSNVNHRHAEAAT